MSPHRIVPAYPASGANTEILGAIYRAASFGELERRHYRADGTVSPWALDVRRALGEGSLLYGAAHACLCMLATIGGARTRQVAGRGFGSALLIGAIVAQSPCEMRGGLVRDRRKPNGFRELVEGAILKGTPVWIVDDILGSGNSAAKAATTLVAEGYSPEGVLAIFKFGWKDHEKRLAGMGLEARWLAKLERGR